MNGEKFLEIVGKYKNKPLPERKFDQFYATAETVIKRRDLILKYYTGIYRTNAELSRTNAELTEQAEKDAEGTKITERDAEDTEFSENSKNFSVSSDSSVSVPLIPTKIIFLGDDDLTSIALALTQKFEKIIVLDIDDRILNFINEITKKENLKIETRNYD